VRVGFTEGSGDEKQARDFLRKTAALQKPKDQKQTRVEFFRPLARAGFGMKTIFSRFLKRGRCDDETLSTLEGVGDS